MRLLEKYVFKELMKSFLMTFFIFTLLIFLISAMQVIQKYSDYLDFLGIISLMPYMICTTLSFTIPMALLPAITLTYNRMTQDREILILRSCGIHARYYFSPSMLLGVICCAFCLVLNSELVPFVNGQKNALAYRAINLVISASFSSEKTTITYIRDLRVYYDRLEDGKFRDLLIQRLDLENNFRVKQEFLARSGSLIYDETVNSLTFELEKGTATDLEHDKDRNVIKQQSINFHKLSIPLSLETTKTETKIRQERAKYKRSWDLYLHIIEQQAYIKGLVRARYKKQKWYKNTRDDIPERYVELHRRFSFSFSPFIIIFIGVPLGMLIQHNNRLMAFGISSLPIILLYYPLMMFGKALGEKGTINPILAVWMCNIVVGAIGVGLLIYVFRR